ncbi:MAG: cbb3-type cytochrome c oxidase subunit I, partial [Candidatus Micrarchaeaceae archaeon]
QIIMTSKDIIAGKAGFQKADLMDYGSLYGMGSYFGEDYTAQYLVDLAKLTENNISQQLFKKDYVSLSKADQYVARRMMQQQLHSIKLQNREVTLPSTVADAIIALREKIAKDLLTNNLHTGYTKAYSLNSKSAFQVANFMIYSSITTVARRPGKSYSYTNNWPYEPIVKNTPTVATFEWTWISYIWIFFMFGVVLYIYHLFLSEQDEIKELPIFKDFVGLTSSQKATGKYFIVVAGVFIVQILTGAVLAHYYSDRSNFFGIVLNYILPFNVMRDIHLQGAIVWIGLSWIAAALFIAPLIAGKESRGQSILVNLLFWVTLIVVAGALIGDYLGVMGVVGGKLWFWLGNQGLAYLELGRLWQIGFFIGLVFWSLVVFRALWPTKELFFKTIKELFTGQIKIEHLFWVSTLNIALLYGFGMIPLLGINPSFTITDYWRWWVVHLWVEQSFEFFAAVTTAYLLMATGLVSRKLAERSVYLELILIFLGGVIGTGHHWYWVGEPGMWIPLGVMFSFIEILPLVLLILEAMQQYNIIKKHQEFHYTLAYVYIIGAAFWNFVGAGVFGGGINSPLMNYYEHSTFLTLNHAHTSLFGAFGLLAIGLIYFCLRYGNLGNKNWSNKLGLWAFWLYNAGMVLWIALNFFPIGWSQLNAVFEHGLAYARSLKFYNTTLLWQWLRMPGDLVFSAGVFIMAIDFIIKLHPFFTKSSKLFTKEKENA